MAEVRWELDLRGFEHVKLLLSGSLNKYQIQEYNEFADAYGVGTAISNAPVIDFSMDIVEVDGKPLAKRGKRSGSKGVFRCKDCLEIVVLPSGKNPASCACGGKMENILRPFVFKGKTETVLPVPKEIREFVINQLEKVNI